MVGVVRALDADIGENAQMDYRIIGSDGPGVFDIAANRSTQDGVIVLRKVSQGQKKKRRLNSGPPPPAGPLSPEPGWNIDVPYGSWRPGLRFCCVERIPADASSSASQRRRIDSFHHVIIKGRMT